MRVLLTGATGFVGPVLVARLIEAGHHCYVLSRRPERAGAMLPAPADPLAYHEPWPVVDAVINMAGENVAGLWTPAKRRRIMQSRTGVTQRLVEWMRVVSPPPHTLVSMSAIGIYGHRPGEILIESSPPDPARKFRAEVTLAWEARAEAAAELGVRVVRVRLANVLHPAGGYLGTLLAVYGYLPVIVGLGHGSRCFSWISRRDAVRLLQFALDDERINGVLNASSPEPVNRETFTTLLAQALDKRAVGRLPDFLLKLALGEFSSALLDSQSVLPARAESLGFRFEDVRLGPFLKKEISDWRLESGN